MAVFFFLVGLEIKREALTGEFSTFRQASLPVAAAVGGMIVPVLIYTSWNYGAAGESMAMAQANRLGVRSQLAYFLIGLGAWAAFLASAVHATTTGALTAMRFRRARFSMKINSSNQRPTTRRLWRKQGGWITNSSVQFYAAKRRKAHS